MVKIKIKILKAGKLNKHIFQPGFTLMELIVVVFIISIMLAFAVPEVSQKFIRDDTEIAINWMVQNIEKLKQDACVNNNDMQMCLQSATNSIHISNKGDSLESQDVTEFSLPDDITIDSIDFSVGKMDMDSNPCILFYKNGYSDWAVIHLSNVDGDTFSLVVQPFLPKIETYMEYIEF